MLHINPDYRLCFLLCRDFRISARGNMCLGVMILYPCAQPMFWNLITLQPSKINVKLYLKWYIFVKSYTNETLNLHRDQEILAAWQAQSAYYRSQGCCGKGYPWQYPLKRPAYQAQQCDQSCSWHNDRSWDGRRCGRNRTWSTKDTSWRHLHWLLIASRYPESRKHTNSLKTRRMEW